jgi:exosortase
MKEITDKLRPSGRHWALAWALAAIALALTSNAVLDMLRLSIHDEESQYLLLSPFLIAYLVWVRRSRLPYCRLGGGWPGLLAVAAGWFAWSYGYRKSIPTLWHGGPILMAAGAFVSVVGIDTVRRFLPAFVALLFMVPVTPTRRQIIAAPLERYAAEATAGSCELLGLHVERYGNLLTVNGTNVEVAEACNGMRMVITFWLVCYLISFGQPWRWYTRGLMLLAVPFVAIGSNVVRLVPTVWMYSRGRGDAADQFHELTGWVMLGVAFIVLYGLIGVLRWIGVPVRRFDLALS